MAVHSSMLAWRIPMDRGAWWATVHPWGCKESNTTDYLSTAQLHVNVITFSNNKAAFTHLSFSNITNVYNVENELPFSSSNDRLNSSSF